jgi:hypothetical protein
MRTADVIIPIKRAFVATIAACALIVAIPTYAEASSILLDNGSLLDGFLSSSLVGSGQGYTTGIQVSVPIQLTAFGSYFCMPTGGQAKFMIWDGTNTTLLHSDTLAVAADASCNLSIPHSLVLDTLASPFTLNVGTYFFGEIFDSPFTVSRASTVLLPPPDGLQYLFSGSSFNNFSSPVPAGPGVGVLGLQFQGTEGTTAVPEPATLTLTALGLAGAVTRWRRRRASC